MFHTAVVRKQLTQHIPDFMNDMQDELNAALSDNIPLTDGTQLSYLCFLFFNPLCVDWTPHVAFEKTLNIVARITSRAFVGLPLCTTRHKIKLIEAETRSIFIMLSLSQPVLGWLL